MARKKKNKGDGLRGDEWMATYADTVTSSFCYIQWQL